MNDRPSRDFILMETAKLWAQRSTCSRLHVGAVIARDSRILTTGYNGAPSGMPHCDHTCTCPSSTFGNKKHSKGCPAGKPCLLSVHAEANTIAFAARYGLSLDGAFLYTTHTPCRPCCMLIVNAGIAAVVWEQDYLRDDGLELLKAGKVGYGKYRPPASSDDMMGV
jgi:dCMP deaminase